MILDSEVNQIKQRIKKLKLNIKSFINKEDYILVIILDDSQISYIEKILNKLYPNIEFEVITPSESTVERRLLDEYKSEKTIIMRHRDDGFAFKDYKTKK